LKPQISSPTIGIPNNYIENIAGIEAASHSQVEALSPNQCYTNLPIPA